MHVICEECGAKNEIDVSEVTDRDVAAQCKFCSRTITIPENTSSDIDIWDKEILNTIQNAQHPKPETVSSYKTDATVLERPAKPVKRRPFFSGLRAKMIVFFLIVPLVIIGLASLFLLNNYKNLASTINNESREIVVDISRDIVGEKAFAVARQVSLYLKTHSDFAIDNCSTNQEFMKIAVQKLGKTGYTILNSAPTSDKRWIIRAHPQKALIGADSIAALKAKLDLPAFRRLQDQYDQALATGDLTTDHYLFFDNREKFIALAPIQGTNLWVSAVTNVDDFTVFLRNVTTNTHIFLDYTVKIFLTTLVITAVLMATVAILYTTRFVNTIKGLTEAANQINAGTINQDIQIHSKDELGDLAEAINRIRQPIQSSISSSPGK